ncbi:hypothetical protein SAMN04488505_105332 [Chitinophaga rupis]|uniref:HEAT repeat domain-containing protein n=1 Tax=Chitinophaga rupis TaxID=573321 RepID=A0A1H8A899_9BACT|nr:hypothetical protein [Chitinophaga rupis]SEM66134.1 hypothetical protein SAMN04488505_105332 [Chitinophaga rupis]
MKKLIIWLLLLITLGARAQSKDTLGTQLQELVEKITNGTYKPYSIVQELGLTQYPQSFIEKTIPYRTWPQADVQEKIYEVYYDYGIHAKSLPLRQNMVNQLLEACTDSVATSYACLYVSDLLRSFLKPDFDATAREKLLKIMNSPRFNTGFAKLTGFLGDEKYTPILLQLSHSSGTPSDAFTATIALARMGQAAAAKSVVDSLKRIDNTGDLLRLHYEDLLYLKIPAVLPIIEKILYSNEIEEPLKPTIAGQPFAFSALNILALNVANFPISYKAGGITDETSLKKARVWMKANRQNVRFDTSKY